VESGCCLTLLRPRLATVLDLVDNVFMIREYMEAAMATAEYEPLDDSSEVYGRTLSRQGVWATGTSREECRRTLDEVLEGWILLGIRFGDELPEIDGKRIEIPETVRR